MLISSCCPARLSAAPPLSFAATEAVSTGPLEATAASLARDIEAKGVEGRELQRRWVVKQTELVALQVRTHRLGRVGALPADDAAWPAASASDVTLARRVVQLGWERHVPRGMRADRPP